jgi:hypothetical protein
MEIEKTLTLKAIIKIKNIEGIENKQVSKVYVMDDDLEIAEISRFLPLKVLDLLLEDTEID